MASAHSEKVRVKVSGMPAYLCGPCREAVLACRKKKDASSSGRARMASSFSKQERRVMRYSAPMPISEWAEKYRFVETGSIRGRWKNIFTPYLAGIMDVMGESFVETGIVCKSPQTGGSEAGHNVVGYAIDRLPGDVMYVYPDEITARENARDRIIPMLEHTPRLAGYMTDVGDDASSLRIKLVHMTIYLGWSGSVSRLGNKPIRTLILDELDKYKDVKNEATSQDLAEKRTITWKEKKKIFKISTPTVENGNIWRAYTTEAEVRFVYFVKCPHCGKMLLMKLSQIMWSGKDTDEEPTFD
ncbi:MAG: phage terminase large subunit family protein, partial [Mailhella sp.]